MKLSGGQIQRVGIARSLYNDPSILVFDEVTSSLDAIAERKFYETISTLLSNNKTIIIITHKVDYLNRAYIIHLIKDTKVYKSGTFKELQSDVEFQKLLIHSKYNKL